MTAVAEFRVFRGILCLLHLVEPVSRVCERHGHAGSHVAAGSVAVGQTGDRPFSLQWGQTHLNCLAKQQHSLGQWVAENRQARGTVINSYCGFLMNKKING